MYLGLMMGRRVNSCFVILLWGMIVHGQYRLDTTIPKQVLYDLHKKICWLQESAQSRWHAFRLLKELKRTDTLSNSKDSLVVNFLSGIGSVIKKEKKSYRSGYPADSTVTHYNRAGLPEYKENWAYPPPDKENERDHSDPIFGDGFVCYRNDYCRFEYDRLGRMTKYVFHISTPVTRRITITYASDGSATRKTIVIDESEFWD